MEENKREPNQRIRTQKSQDPKQGCKYTPIVLHVNASRTP
jgi:hypothetical protein